jgi:hypothetical protein
MLYFYENFVESRIFCVNFNNHTVHHDVFILPPVFKGVALILVRQ